MQYIVIVDHRENNGGISVITKGDDYDSDSPEIYNNIEDARKCTKEQFLAKSFPCIIINLDTQEVEE